jgi:hypothetical protein
MKSFRTKEDKTVYFTGDIIIIEEYGEHYVQVGGNIYHITSEEFEKLRGEL